MTLLESILLEVTNAVASRARLELEMDKEDHLKWIRETIEKWIREKWIRDWFYRKGDSWDERRRPVLSEDTLYRPNKTHLSTISRQWCQGALGSRADSVSLS